MRNIILICFLLLIIVPSLTGQPIIGDNIVDKGETVTYTNMYGPCGPDCEYLWEVIGAASQTNTSESSITVTWENQDRVGSLKLRQEVPNTPGYIIDIQELTILIGDPIELEFSYDAAGNRTRRWIVHLVSNTRKSLVNDSEFLNDIKDDLMEKKIFKVYPNPANQYVYVALNNDAIEAIDRTIFIYDLNGRILLQIPVENEIEMIDMSSYGPGIYILRLSYGNNTKECKIIKH